MQKIHYALCFKSDALEAAKFYTTLFRGSKINRMAYYGERIAKATNQPVGSVLSVDFTITGQDFVAINGPDMQYSPATSFTYYCESIEEIDMLWKALNHQTLMGLDKYPWSERYGWCSDKYGVSWQLLLNPQAKGLAASLLFVNKNFSRAEEAIRFYTNVIKDSKVENIMHHEGQKTVLYSMLTLAGHQFTIMEEGSKEHKFDPTPAVSYMIYCKDQKEIDYYWEKLTADGGKEWQCGWLIDKFGITWQVVPESLVEMSASLDKKKADNVMMALEGMTKLIEADLIAAFEK